jgi:hypothetical protein
MEDITGFDDQIGFFNAFKRFKKATQNIQRSIVKRTPTVPSKNVLNKSFYNQIAQRAKMMQAAKAKNKGIFNRFF